MLTILIDDLRSFKDGRACLIARDDKSGLELLRTNHSHFIDELWLDHDLGKIDGKTIDIKDIVYELEYRAFHDDPYQIGVIFVHTLNPPGGDAVVKGLVRQGYNVKRFNLSPELEG